MKKFILMMSFLFSISSLTYAGLLGDLSKIVKDTVKEGVGISSQDVVPNENASKSSENVPSDQSVAGSVSQSTPGAINQYADLKTAAYGIPLGEPLQVVLKWCEDKKVKITNKTKEEVQADASRKAELLQEVIDQSRESKSFTYQEIEKLVQGSTTDDYLEQAKIEAIKKDLEVLKNPTFNFNNENKLFYAPFIDGIPFIKDNDRYAHVFCLEKSITDSIYAIVIEPTAESNNLARDKVSSISIYFAKNTAQALTSVAALICYASDNKNVFEDVVLNLDQKYGQHLYMDDTTIAEIGYDWFVPQDSTQDEIFMNNFDSISRRLLLLTMANFGTAIGWRANIALFGGEAHALAQNVYVGGFVLFYAEPNLTKAVLESQIKALRDWKNKELTDVNRAREERKADF